MKQCLLLITAFLCLLSHSLAATPADILQQVDEFRAPASSFSFSLKIIKKNAEGEDDTSLYRVRVKENKKSIVVQNEPKFYKGRVFLMVDENMWIFIPKTRRPIRISPQQQMIGNVSNADVARVVYHLDYDVASMNETEEGQTLLLKLTAKTKGAAYKKIDLFIEKDGHRPLRADLFAFSGRLLKSVFYENYQEVLGRSRPLRLKVQDALNPAAVSIMEYDNMAIEETPDRYFQKNYMERASSQL